MTCGKRLAQCLGTQHSTASSDPYGLQEWALLDSYPNNSHCSLKALKGPFLQEAPCPPSSVLP